MVKQPNAVAALTPWAQAVKSAGTAKTVALQEAARSRHEAQARRELRASRPKMKGSEQVALAHLTDTWQTHKEIGARSGQSEGVVWRALEGLRAKGVIEGGGTPGTVVINGRPKHSQWRKAGGAA